MQWCGICAGPDITADDTQRQDRDIQFVTAVILQGEKFVLVVVDGKNGQAAVASNAMILVYYWIVDLQFRQRTYDGVGITVGLAAAPALKHPLTVQLGLGQHDQFGRCDV